MPVSSLVSAHALVSGPHRPGRHPTHKFPGGTGCLADLVSEADELAVDASVSPRWVLGGEAQDQPAKLDGRWWSTGRPAWQMGPMPGDASAVPAQQRVGGDDPALAEPVGECCGDHGAQGSVVVVDELDQVVVIADNGGGERLRVSP